ncbi:unnamed protein product [Ectocarpus sp. 13 AM-2016]
MQTPNTQEYNHGRQTAGANVRCREGNNPDRQLRSPIPIKFAGGIRSANADMSNDKGGEKPPRRKIKVSLVDAMLPGKASKLQI